MSETIVHVRANTDTKRITIFLAVVFIPTWLWILGVLGPLDLDLNLYTLLPVTVMPAVATIVSTLATRPSHLRPMLSSAFTFRGTTITLVVAVVVAFAAASAEQLISPSAFFATEPFPFEGVVELLVIAAFELFAAVGLLLGWVSGLFMPLTQRNGVSTSAFIVGALAAVWGLPLFTLVSYAQAEGADDQALVASTVLAGVVIAFSCVLSSRSRGSLWPAIAYTIVFALVSEVLSSVFFFGDDIGWIPAVIVLIATLIALLVWRRNTPDRKDVPA